MITTDFKVSSCPLPPVTTGTPDAAQASTLPGDTPPAAQEDGSKNEMMQTQS
jgi:hypothetical protein